MPREVRHEFSIRFPLDADDKVAEEGVFSAVQYDPWGGLNAAEQPIRYGEYLRGDGAAIAQRVSELLLAQAKFAAPRRVAAPPEEAQARRRRSRALGGYGALDTRVLNTKIQAQLVPLRAAVLAAVPGIRCVAGSSRVDGKSLFSYLAFERADVVDDAIVAGIAVWGLPGGAAVVAGDVRRERADAIVADAGRRVVPPERKHVCAAIAEVGVVLSDAADKVQHALADPAG